MEGIAREMFLKSAMVGNRSHICLDGCMYSKV